MLGAWALLLSAITVEVGATAALPRTHGFREPLWTLAVLGGYALSIWLLAVVIRQIPVSVTYAVWSASAPPESSPSGCWCSASAWISSRRLRWP